MAKLPSPPTPLTASPATTTLVSGSRIWRVYCAAGAHPTTWNGFRFFGPTNARFDHHDVPQGLQAKGIMYGARKPTTCVAEVFQATRVIDRAGSSPWLVGFEIVRDVVLLDLTGTWPTQAGASMAITSGPRPRAREWSRAIHHTFANVEGLVYGSSMHANETSFALHERALSAMPSAPSFHRALADPALRPHLAAAAATLGYRLV